MQKMTTTTSKTTRIELLPSVIFTIIQDYVNGMSYQQLMNCNKFFYVIKLETMKWDLSINFSKIKDKEIIEKKFYQIKEFISKVKNKHKQIGLHLFKITTKDIIQYSSLFASIATLKISFDEKDLELEELDFSIFNEIDCVFLSGFKQIKEIRNGLQNIRVLKIRNFPSLMQISCPLSGFQRLSIIECPSLSNLPLIHNIAEIHVEDVHVKLSPELLEHSNCQILHYSPSTDLKSHIEIVSKLNVANLHRLFLGNLDSDLKPEHLQLLSKVNCLSLSSAFFPRKDIFLPLFTFNGRTLEIGGFRVFWDKETIFPNLVEIFLDSIDMNSFPLMPKVRNVSLNRCEIEELPSFPECTNLYLEGCQTMPVIGAQPKLSKLTIIWTHNDLTSFDGQFIDTVSIENCNRLTNVSIFRNVRELRLSRCLNITSLIGLTDTDRPNPNDRIVRLYGFDAEVCNISDLSNIYKLQLDNIDNLIDGNGLSNINDLEISNCESFQRLGNIGDIHHSILIRNCSDLRTYEGLNNIPIVILSKVYDVQHLTGLMNCQNLYLHEMKGLTDYAKQFASKDLPPYYSSQRIEVFQSIQHVYEIESKEFPPYHVFGVDYLPSVKILTKLW